MFSDPRDEYLDWKKKENSLSTRISKNIKPAYVFLAIIGLFFLGYLSSQGKFPRGILIGFGIAVVIVFILNLFKEPTKKLLPLHIVKQIVQDYLEKERKEGLEIPFDCEVRVTQQAQTIYETDFISRTSGIIKWDVGFEMIRKGLKETGVVSVHPYDGTIMGIRKERLGYTGKETKDRVIIPVNFQEEK